MVNDTFWSDFSAVLLERYLTWHGSVQAYQQDPRLDSDPELTTLRNSSRTEGAFTQGVVAKTSELKEQIHGLIRAEFQAEKMSDEGTMAVFFSKTREENRREEQSFVEQTFTKRVVALWKCRSAEGRKPEAREERRRR